MLTSAPFHIESELAHWLSCLVALLKLTCLLLSRVCIVDRIGRRPILLAGAAATATATAFAAYVSAMAKPNAPLVLAPLLLLFLASHALSLAPIFLTLVAELFTPRARPLAVALATAATFASGAIADASFLSIRHALGYPGLLGTYSAVCAVGGVTVAIWLPETMGRPLHQVQRLLACRGGGVCCGRCYRLLTSLRTAKLSSLASAASSSEASGAESETSSLSATRSGSSRSGGAVGDGELSRSLTEDCTREQVEEGRVDGADESGYCASEGGGHGGGGEGRSDGVSIAGESELPSEAQTSRTKPPASAFAFAL